MTTNPRIYVASLSDYNAGTLHGAWIDADQDADAIAEEVREMLASSTEGHAEEWAIHDYEGFDSIKLGEWESFETVSTIAKALEEHGPAWAAYYDNQGGLERVDSFEDDYCGEWDSIEDYAQELAGELGAVPSDVSWPCTCIDWERAARDLELGGDNWTADSPAGGVYVFRNH
jgi:antirestriction protein